MKTLQLFSLTFHSYRRAKSKTNVFSQLKGNFKWNFISIIFLSPINSYKNMICPNIKPQNDNFSKTLSKFLFTVR